MNANKKKKRGSEPIIRKAALYLRVSSEEQAKTGDSLREQLETLQDYVDKQPDMVVYDTYIDDGISGQKLDRDEFARLIDDVKAGHIDVILFTKLDRWFRSLRHYLNTQAILEEYGVTWLAVSQPYFDTTTAHGRAFVAQSMTWAELEAQHDSERIIAVFKNKVKNGEVISGTTPFGYKIVDKHFVPDETNSKLVVEIFQRYRQSGNLTDVMKYMREQYGFSRVQSTYRKMLKKRIYIGEYRDNANYCEPIIDRELFNDVQRLLARNKRHNKKYNYLFSGMVRCGECKCAMSAMHLHMPGHRRIDGTRKRYKRPVYRCKKHIDLKTCSNSKVLFESTLEKYLISHLRDDLQKYISKVEIETAPVINISAKRKQIEDKMERLKDLYLNGLITLDEYKIDRAKYVEQLESLPKNELPAKDVTQLKRLLDSNIEEIYNSFDFEDRAEFWRSILQEIIFYSDRTIMPIFM